MTIPHFVTIVAIGKDGSQRPVIFNANKVQCVEDNPGEGCRVIYYEGLDEDGCDTLICLKTNESLGDILTVLRG